MERGRALLRVANGDASVDDILREATTADQHPYLRLRLRQLMLTVPHASPKTVNRVLTITSELFDDYPVRSMTVAWLLDRRSHGRRYQVWADAQRDREAPWPGFPFGGGDGDR